MKFEPIFTIGNLITIVGGVIAIVIAWVKLGDRMDNLNKIQEKQEASLEEYAKLGIMTTVVAHDRRISSLEEAMSDVHEMKADIKWIKSAVDKG